MQKTIEVPRCTSVHQICFGRKRRNNQLGINPNRFPSIEVELEQAFDFWFTRAAECKKRKANNKNYRKDLRLETHLEILKSKRFTSLVISYVQSGSQHVYENCREI